MAKTVIIEWDSQELRIATLGAAGVDQAWSTPLAESTDAAIAEALQQEVSARHLQRAEVLLAVSRREVEVREVAIPPSPPEDHPDMLRMMAPREFTQFDEEAVVDFYETGQNADGMHCMLAASMTGATLQRLKNLLTGAGLTPRWFALRPMCAAVLLPAEAPQPRLIVDLASDEADIAVHDGRRVLSVRNVRLPHDHPHKALGKDLRRTLAVAVNQLGRNVDEVVLFGTAEEHQERTAAWGLELEIRYISGFASSSVTDPSRFASLFGLAKLQQDGESPAFDFLNPRRRPPDPSKVTPVMIGGVAAAVLVAVVGGILWLRLRSLDSQIDALDQELAATKQASANAVELMSHHDEVRSFLDSRVDWLEEMERVSANSLSYQDVTFYKWTGRSLDTGRGGGMLLLDGSADDPNKIDVLEEELRDEGHVVQGRGYTIDPKNSEHPYRFRQLEVSIASPETLEALEASAAAEETGSDEQTGSDGQAGSDEQAGSADSAGNDSNPEASQ